jgi:amylosucrase
MPDSTWFHAQARLSLERLLPRVQAEFAPRMTAEAWVAFSDRLARHFPDLFQLLFSLYSEHYDFFYHLEQVVAVTAASWAARPAELQALDEVRESNPGWFQSNQMLGGVCYVDLYSGDLRHLREKLPYFKELGLTYLHLMPLFQTPVGNSDGGYAVSSYREVNPALGVLEDLRALTTELRQNGISLVLDFIFNHTSHEHAWALQARAGQAEYRDFYHIFPDRVWPDRYERTLREIFPNEHPGAFSPFVPFNSAQTGWVWTTFHTFQWDLNYANPAVFRAMAAEMLFLANLGVEVLRLDAVAFIWKQLGTSCENLPQAHTLIQAFNLLSRIAAPGLLFKSEAIVHPDEVVKYISPGECQLSYNPLLMALAWNSLATRKVRLLRQALQSRLVIDPRCAWVNYVRVHDDIGWTFSDEDAALLGVNGFDHRQFLNQFYTGRFPGSFARGLPFQENPKTGECRISGTCASLAGLEKAVAEGSPFEIELALQRILLLYSLILSVGGIPLIYLGDEIGMLNDYSYAADPAKADDSRWVHRPVLDWGKVARRTDSDSLEGRLFQRFRALITLRQETPALQGSELRVVATRNDHVLAYERWSGNHRLLVLANFADQPETITPGPDWPNALIDLIQLEALESYGKIQLGPYQYRWLVSR